MLDLKSLTDGGIIMQKSFVNRIRSVEDFIPATGEKKDGTIFTARKPTSKEADDLLFAWAVESGVTSNSVIFVRDGATVAIGTGEQDRVGCAEIAIHKAYTKYADVLAFKRCGLSLYELQQKALSDAEASSMLEDINKETREAKGGLVGSVVVSDGFFPFRDGVDVVMAQGVTAIAHPGGSIRDWEVVQACNEHTPQVAMVYTGQRSFKH
jgi:phosphoribosylaminoimidazolecarboxamide formyltransferase/IMP cyclohydrolase